MLAWRAIFGSVVMVLAAGLCASADGLDLDDTPLVTSTGEAVTFSSALFEAPATVISFTFSGCQSICPMSDVAMNDLAVAARDAGAEVALVTITLDPVNDTTEALVAHREKYGFPETANWRWLTGEPQAVFNVLDRLGMRTGLLESHPSFFLVVGRGGARTMALLEASATTATLLETARALADPATP